MAIGPKITRAKESVEELRQMARLCRNVAQARRLLVVASVMDGHSRTAAATAAGMDRQPLRDWVHRFNVEGLGGLVDKPRSGRPTRLNEDQLEDLDEVVEAGPDIATVASCAGAARICNASSSRSTRSLWASARSAAS